MYPQQAQKTLALSTERNIHVCVLEMKTIDLSPYSIVAKSGAVLTITILGILCGTFWIKDVGKLPIQKQHSVHGLPPFQGREWQPDNKADL